MRVFGSPQPNSELSDDEYSRLCEKHGSCTHCGTVTDDGGHGEYQNHCKECEDRMYADLTAYPEELKDTLEELDNEWNGCACHDPRNIII